MIGPVRCRVSRTPSFDHSNTGQIQATPSQARQASGSALFKAPAAISPSAPRYHHQGLSFEQQAQFGQQHAPEGRQRQRRQ
jgi:hypothetical protein